tara:strand:- start:3431 stop:5047 length:1617 start_codon:yes stop_codon:yes gene_type:complete
MSKYSKTDTQLYNEVLNPKDGAGAYVKDFRKSDAPQFKGKTEKEKDKMAVAAYLDAKDKNENFQIAANEEKVKITDMKDASVMKTISQALKKAKDVKATKIPGGIELDGDIKSLTTVVDILFNKTIKGGSLETPAKIRLSKEEIEESISIKPYKNAKDPSKKGLEINKSGGMSGSIFIKDKKELKDLMKKLIQASKLSGLKEELEELFGISSNPNHRVKVIVMLDKEKIEYEKSGSNGLVIKGVSKDKQQPLLNRIKKEVGMFNTYVKEEIEEKLKIPNMKTIKLKNGAKVLDKIYTNRTQADNAASSLMKQHKGAKADAYQSPFNSKFYVRIKEALDKEDEPKVKEIIKKLKELKGASKAHAGQASDLEKSIKEDGHMDVPSSIRMCKTISEDASQIEQSLSSRSDENLDTWWTNKLAVASNSMNKLRDYITTPVEEGRKSRYGVTPSKKRYDPDSGEIHDDESANKHIIMQMRKSVDLKGNFKVEFEDGKKQKVPLDIARAVSNKYNMIKRPAEKEKFQKAAGKSYKDLLKALKEK